MPTTSTPTRLQQSVHLHAADGKLRRTQAAKPRPKSPPVVMSSVACALAVAQGRTRLGSATVARPKAQTPSAEAPTLPFESFADVGRPRAVTPSNATRSASIANPSGNLAARQAIASHNLLKAAVKKRACLSLSTMEPGSSGLPATLQAVREHQARGPKGKAAKRIDFGPAPPIDSADLFVVLQAVRSSTPWVCRVSMTALVVAAGTGRMVAKQLLAAATDLSLLELDIGEDAADRLPAAFRAELAAIIDANMATRRKRQHASNLQRRSRAKRPSSSAAEAPMNDQSDSDAGDVSRIDSSVGGWDRDDDAGAFMDEEAALNQARIIVDENVARFRIMRGYIAGFANLIAAYRRTEAYDDDAEAP